MKELQDFRDIDFAMVSRLCPRRSTSPTILGYRKGETPSRFVAVGPAKMFLQGSVVFALERLTGVQEVDQNSVVRRLAGMQEH